MSKLQSYLDDTSTSQAEFARQLGVSRSYMSELATGIKSPGLERAFQIQRLTGGKVPAASWVADKQRGKSVTASQGMQNITEVSRAIQKDRAPNHANSNTAKDSPNSGT